MKQAKKLKFISQQKKIKKTNNRKQRLKNS